MNSGKKMWTRLLFVTAVALFSADRFLKATVLAAETAPTDELFSFALFKNSGIIFSIPVSDMLFWPFAALIFAILWLAFFTSIWREPLPASMVLLLNAGATSNLIDRVLYGATIDYLVFFGRSAVNIADAMIVAGVMLLYLHHRRSEAA